MDDTVLMILIALLFTVVAGLVIIVFWLLIRDARQRSMLAALEEIEAPASEPPHPEHARVTRAAEYLSTSLPPDLSRATYAGAVLHWFDADLLATLVPEWHGRAAAIYKDVQNLSFVEALSGGRHSIHTPTRTAMLAKLWQEQRGTYQQYALRAARYFARRLYADRSSEISGWRAVAAEMFYRFPPPNSDRFDEQIEWLYHLAPADPDHATSALKFLGNKWTYEQRFDQLDRLVTTLMEHVEARRVTGPLRATIYYYLGRNHLRMKRVHEALEALLRARDGAGSDLQLWMNSVSAIGDTLPFFEAPDWGQLLPEASFDEARARRAGRNSPADRVRAFRRANPAGGDVAVTQRGGLIQIGASPARQSSLQRRYFTFADALTRRYQMTWATYRVWADRLGGYRRHWTPWDDRLMFDRHANTLKSYTELRELYRAQNRLPDEAQLARLLGDEYVFRHQFADALQAYQDALTLYNQGVNRLGSAQTHKAIGDARQLMGRHAEALSAYDEALKLYRQLEPRAGQDRKLTPELAIAETLLARGQALHALSRLKDARDQYDEALAIYRAKDVYAGEAAALVAIGNLLELTARSDAAQVRYDEARRVYERHADRLGLAQLDLLTGDRWLRAGQINQAINAYENALTEYRVELDHVGEAHALKSLGDTYRAGHDLDKAIEHYAQALRAYQAVRLLVGEADTQAAWGQVYVQSAKRDKQQAIEHFEAALRVYRLASHQLGEADMQLAIGQELRRQGQYAEAQRQIEAAGKTYIGLHHLAGQAHVLQAQGEVRLAQSDLTGALKSFQQAYHLFEQLGDLESQMNTLTTLGHAQVALDRNADAVRTYGHAITLAVNLPPEHRTAHGVHGYQALAHGDYVRAAAHFEAAVQQDEEVEWKLGWGIAHYGQGKVVEARELLAPAWRLANADEQAAVQRWLEHIRVVKHEAQSLPEIATQLGLES